MNTLRTLGDFSINRQSYLWRRGLRFAEIGLHWGASAAFDAGPLRGKGIMSGSVNQSSWSFSEPLGRPQIFFTNAAAKIDYGIYPILGSGAWSVSAWVFPLSSGFWDGPIVEWGNCGTAHQYVAVNVDNTGYLHVDQAGASNSATFLGALDTDAWNHILYSHRPNSPVNGDTLWVNGVQASGGGSGSTTLDIQTGDTLAVGESPQGSALNVYAAMADIMIFDQQLGLADAERLSRTWETDLLGLITADDTVSPYDLEGVR